MPIAFSNKANSNSQNKIDFLFDTGASVSLMAPSHFKLFSKHGLVAQKIHCNPVICDASGSPMQSDGVYNITFYYDKIKMNGIFIVSSSLSGPPIVGMNIMSQFGLSLDPITRRVTVPSNAPPLPDSGSSKPWLVSVAEATRIQPHEGRKVKCRLLDPETREPLKIQHEFIADIYGVLAATKSSESGTFQPFLPNTTDEAIDLEGSYSRESLKDRRFPLFRR